MPHIFANSSSPVSSSHDPNIINIHNHDSPAASPPSISGSSYTTPSVHPLSAMFAWLISACSSDSCGATPPAPPLSSLLILTALFLVMLLLSHRRLLPLLESRLLPALPSPILDGDDHILPSHAPPGLRAVHADHANRSAVKRASAFAFSLTVSLAAGVATLVVCEVADLFPQRARAAAMGVAVPALVFLLVVVGPVIQARSIVVALTGTSFRTSAGALCKRSLTLFGLFMTSWFLAFYSVGAVVPHAEPTLVRKGWLYATHASATTKTSNGLVLASLARIGVIGVALTALLSGFAAVSAPWTTFVQSVTSPFRRPASNRAAAAAIELAVTRKQGALDSASELLAAKRHRIAVLERRSSDDSTSSASTVPRSPSSLVGKVLGTFRGPSADEAESKTLRLEIAGLEAMSQSLAAQLSTLLAKRAAAVRARTCVGRLLAVPDYVFAVYCVYRILNTSLTALSRLLLASAATSTSAAASDPVSRALSLVVQHWDSSIDVAGWARQISFLLSGGILLLSANSALQTAHILSRWAPRALLAHARSNLPLLLGQMLAIYVIAAAMLLRSSLPSDARAKVADALGGGVLQLTFVDRWFETWFLVAGAVTAAGIWIGGKLDGEEEDEFDAEEKGTVKMS